MIEFTSTTPPLHVRPWSVTRADEGLTMDRRARILAAVRRGIAQYEREQDARWACAAEAWAPFLAACDDA